MKKLVKYLIIQTFHWLSYRMLKEKTLTWFGVPFIKFPHDLIFYQKIIFETKPDLIIETGTKHGGTTLFLAQMLDLVGNGQIITIELNSWRKLKFYHPRIIQLIGSSTDPEIFNKIDFRGKVMVILDSDHSKAHVLKELELYAPMVSKGCYLIVEDTNIGIYDKRFWDWRDRRKQNSPLAALKEFNLTGFEPDNRIEEFYLTMSHDGYWVRI